MSSLGDGRYLGQFRPEFSRLHRDRDLYWIVPLRAPLVIGLLGRRFVGVSTAIAYLQERHGFDAYTLGGELRRIAEDRGVPVSHRGYLQNLGDELRAEQDDAGFLARRTLRHIRADRLLMPNWQFPRSIVVGGFKTEEEVEIFKKLRGFVAVELRTRDEPGSRPTRLRRVERSGVLHEEYESERLRFGETNPTASSSRPRYDDLDADARRRYFDDLDRIHDDGHPGTRWASPYRGCPAQAIAAAASRVRIDNDTESLNDFHRAIDDALDRLRPRQQVVHR